ncbi:MAG: hypothetical protein JW745_03485 [Sedimentisphaerales bacterium]|nr:hypothetical protein [Sedimentisphaerales bacterium]MBN2842930.1 hypothetical protein [Sedimentisphaerales bacterium]
MQRSEFTETIASDCVHYRGDGPCIPHLKYGATCRCDAYAPVTRKLLFVLLSSRTDVIRSSVILSHIKGNDPNCRITCVTHWPELLPSFVNEAIKPAQTGILRIQNDYFDMAVNFGLDADGCALMRTVQASKSYGFTMKKGSASPLDSSAESLWHKMLFPVKKRITNYANYSYRQALVREFFDLCQVEYLRQLPVIELPGIRAGNPGQVALVTGKTGSDPLASKLADLSQAISAKALSPVTMEVPGDNDIDGAYSINGNYVNVPEKLPQILASSEVVLTDQIWVAEFAWATGRRIVLLNGKPDSRYSDSDYIGRGRVIPEDADINTLASVVLGLSIAHDDDFSAGKLLEDVKINHSSSMRK